MKLPEPRQQPDFSLLTSPEGDFWLAYELPRDFLSAPRQFCVISGSLGVDGQMFWLQPPQDVQGVEEDFLLQEGTSYLLSLSNSQQELKLRACKLIFIENIYHPQGPHSALLASLGKLPAS